jgi:hypothetical protein
MRYALLLGLLLSGMAGARQPDPEAPKPLKIHVLVMWNHSTPKAELVLRSAVELAKTFPPAAAGLTAAEKEAQAVKELTQVLGVKEIDWKTQMLVVLSQGKPAESYHTFKLTGIDVKNGTATVHATHYLPGAYKLTKNAPYLTIVALVDRFEGPVQFDVKSVALK